MNDDILVLELLKLQNIECYLAYNVVYKIGKKVKKKLFKFVEQSGCVIKEYHIHWNRNMLYIYYIDYRSIIDIIV